jgi:hypothetical protein
MSNERCSTATSGFYSATESDCSNSTKQSITNAELSNFGPSRCQSLGLPEAERKLEKSVNKDFQKNADSGQKYVSRIPPPKPLRYKIQKSTRDLPYLRANSDGDQSSKSTIQNSRTMQNTKKTSNLMDKRRKDEQILV